MKLAVFGKIRAGKTAVCEYIMENFDDVEKFEFSDPVQEVIDITYPEYKGVKDRMLLIGVGQHLRNYDEDIWTNVIKHRIENSKAKHILVAGVRQPNEYLMLKKLGFKFIRVHCTEEIRIARCIEQGDKFKVEDLKNQTEMFMDAFQHDYMILNNRSFKELEISIRNILGDILMEEECERALFADGIADFYERNGLGEDKDARD